MQKGIAEKGLPEVVANFVESILQASKFAESVNINIKIEQNRTPTISYSVDGLRMVVPTLKGENNGE